MPSLTYAGAIHITEHATLGQVGMPLLRDVDGPYEVLDNATLSRLMMASLEEVGSIHISGNPALNTCALVQNLSRVQVVGDVTIEPGCP